MPVVNPCDLLSRLLKEPSESEWLEFKMNKALPDEIGEYASALANSAMLSDQDRGYLVYGVSNAREKVGTEIRFAHMKGKGNENLQNWIARLLEPRLMVEFLDFECEGKRFAIMCVEPTYDRPVKFKGVEYIRIGENKKKLSDFGAHERALWLATGRRKFEHAVALSNQSASEVLEFLDTAAFYELANEPVPVSPDEKLKRLLSFGAIKDNMEGRYDILNLGAIVFAKEVTDLPSIASKSVRVIRYLGVDKRNSEPEREGTRGYAVGFTNMMKYIMQRTTEERIVDGVRTTISLVPEIAVREVLANALIHQDFTATGVGPTVEIYSNRIEITNPGPSLIDTDRMVDARKSRNEKLAEAMRTLRLCEERGSGLDRALLEIELNHQPAPEFIRSPDAMRVVLFGRKPFTKMSKAEKLRGCFYHCVLRWLVHDPMSNSSLRERFGLPQSEYQAVSAIISEAMKSGRIGPADPTQGRRNARYVPYWAL